MDPENQDPITEPVEQVTPVTPTPKTNWATSFIMLLVGILIGTGGLWGYQNYFASNTQPISNSQKSVTNVQNPTQTPDSNPFSIKNFFAQGYVSFPNPENPEHVFYINTDHSYYFWVPKTWQVQAAPDFIWSILLPGACDVNEISCNTNDLEHTIVISMQGNRLQSLSFDEVFNANNSSYFYSKLIPDKSVSFLKVKNFKVGDLDASEFLVEGFPTDTRDEAQVKKYGKIFPCHKEVAIKNSDNYIKDNIDVIEIFDAVNPKAPQNCMDYLKNLPATPLDTLLKSLKFLVQYKVGY